MNSDLLKYWWLNTLSGILLFAFGIYAIQNPHISLSILMKYLGMMILLLGGLLLAGGIHASRYAGISYFWIIESAIHLCVGGFIFIFPEMAITLAVMVVGLWSVTLGIIQILVIKIITSKRYSTSLYVLNSILGIAFGAYIMFTTSITDALLITSIGIFCLLYGVSSYMIAFNMRWVIKKLS